MKIAGIDSIERRADNGDVDAQYYLSLLYEGVKDCPKNLYKSAEWCLRAAEAGDKLAQYRLSKMYETGKGFDKAGEHTAYHWLKESACNGHANAQFDLGLRHLFGILGVKKSMVNARKFLLGAANHEHAEAMYYLGFMQMHGLGAAHDCGSAYMWFCRAAELNCEKAQCSLGLFYAHGICCDLDIELARYWYERASLRGHAGAQFALACVYVSLGQKKNAAVWTSIAANNGVLVAQALLAKIYMNGLGVSRDLSTAMMWCLIVQANVDVDIDSLEIVLKCQSSILRSTSDDVIDLARERASEWFASRHDFASQSRLPS